jgi:hypothetical protein
MLKTHPEPVIEALRARIRRQGIRQVAADLCMSENYTRGMSTGARKMTRFVAWKLGYVGKFVWTPATDPGENPNLIKSSHHK